jgi:hypothetical protein
MPPNRNLAAKAVAFFELVLFGFDRHATSWQSPLFLICISKNQLVARQATIVTQTVPKQNKGELVFEMRRTGVPLTEVLFYA